MIVQASAVNSMLYAQLDCGSKKILTISEEFSIANIFAVMKTGSLRGENRQILEYHLQAWEVLLLRSGKLDGVNVLTE